MKNHPIETAFAILTGSVVGINSLFPNHPIVINLDNMFSLAALVIFVIACCKATIVGCCSWLGASAARYVKKIVALKYKNYKNKK